MKLYATTTSERASKGQGGNDFLSIRITAEIKGARELVGIIAVYPPVGHKAGIFLTYSQTKANATIKTGDIE